MSEKNASEKAHDELKRRGIKCENGYLYLGRPDLFVVAGEWDERRRFRVPWIAFVTHKTGQRFEVIDGGVALTRFGARARAFTTAYRTATERGAEVT